MKILYAGMRTFGTTSRLRRFTLERLGCEVVPIDSEDYVLKNQTLGKICLRLCAGPHADRLNRDLLRLAETERPDVFWADKLLLLHPETLKKLNARGITTVSWMIDNPFGPRKDPGFRLYKKNLPLFDLHVQQRDVSVKEYKRRGAKDVVKVLIGFDVDAHRPSPVPITDADRDREVSFIGTPYDDRQTVLTSLSDAGLPVVISGSEPAWRRALRPDAFIKMFRGGALYGDAYREAIWRSKINLSFLTKSNQDEYTQKSFEIAACGGFLLAERSEGHMAKFKEDEEAVFFTDTEELIAKIRKYLPDEAVRNRIAAAGRERAVRDGYDSENQLRIVLARVQEIAARKRPAAVQVSA